MLAQAINHHEHCIKAIIVFRKLHEVYQQVLPQLIRDRQRLQYTRGPIPPGISSSAGLAIINIALDILAL